MFIVLPSQRGLLLQDIEILTTLKDKATLKESLDQLSMTQEEVLHLLKLTSETPIDISTELSISSQLREHTLDSTSSVEEKLPSQSATFSPLTELPKVPLSATLNLQLEIRDHTQDALEHTPPLSDTPKMEAEPESDYHQDLEKLFPEAAEPPLELLLEVEEMKSLS